jgi:uncharacterized damage-inducible protein DinB
MSETGKALIARARYHLSEDFLPKIERCLDVLSDEQIWWRANPKSNSIGNLILHLSGNVRQWIICGLGGEKDARDRDAEFAHRESISRAELLSLLKGTLNQVDQTLARFDPERLLETRMIQGLEVSALEAILHVVEHFSMHTGQVILLTKLLTASDLHFYDFEGQAPTLRWSSDRPRST